MPTSSSSASCTWRATRTSSGSGTIRTGETAVEKLELALELERVSIDRLNRGIELCVRVGDNGTRDLLARILTGEEDHADWIETQLELTRQVGEQIYLSQQIRD